MDYVRTLVSGKKNRYIDDKYNLDLTYVTPRIIAMAFPGSGITTVYRNRLTDVADFLHERHNSHFKILNLSGNPYDTTRFDNKVLNFDEWPDHHAPPFSLLFQLIDIIHTFLSENYQNVIVINCNAGKGRTGTLICCYLLYSNCFNNTKDAFDYYSLKRFHKGFGVTHSSQKRYVEYFFKTISTKEVKIPVMRVLTKIDITCCPYETDASFQPKYEIINGKNQMIKQHSMEGKRLIITPSINKHYPLSESDLQLPVCGDLLIRLYNDKEKIGRLSFNTSFIPINKEEIIFLLPEIDPYKFSINPKVRQNYSIILHMGVLCKKDCYARSTHSLCNNCRELLKDEINTYYSIKEFLRIARPTWQESKILLFGDIENEDIEKTLSKRGLLRIPTIDRRSEIQKKKDDKCIFF